jgi:hypothetical protein
MRSFLLVAGLLGVASPVLAQSATYRVKLHEPWSLRLAPQVRTTFDAPLRGDSLALPRKEGGALMVPRRDVYEIDSLIGVIPRAARIRKGAVSGGISGAVIGATLGLLTFRDGKSGSLDSRPMNALAGAAVVGTVGSIIGAISGAVGSGERWERVWPVQ